MSCLQLPCLLLLLRIRFSGYCTPTDWGRQELCFGKVHSRMFAQTSSLTIKLCILNYSIYDLKKKIIIKQPQNLHSYFPYLQNACFTRCDSGIHILTFLSCWMTGVRAVFTLHQFRQPSGKTVSSGLLCTYRRQDQLLYS